MPDVQLPPSLRRLLPCLRPHVELEEWSLVPRGERWLQMRGDYGLPRESTRWWEDELGFEPDFGYLSETERDAVRLEAIRFRLTDPLSS